MLLLLVLITAEEPASQPFTTVVTATRTPRPLRDSPSDTYVIAREEIDQSSALTTEDLVRSDPDAQTFRRSSSLIADPTSQGLSLRGVGPSAVSRALVLRDGIPINDGYGGWVYWRSVPALSIDRVEIVPGGGSAQYGSGALGGVLQFFSRPLDVPRLDADAQVGTQGTMLGAVRAVERWRWLAVSLAAEGLHSDGYVVTAPGERGPVDVASPTTHATVEGKIEADFRAVRLFLGGGYFDETQNSGTALSGSHVHLGHAELGADWQALGDWQARLFGRLEQFDQTRTRISNARSLETLVATQSVPSNDSALSLVWNSVALTALGTHVVSSGVDAREVGAKGSTQQIGGVFAQDAWRPLPRLEILGALRLDLWRNQAATSETAAHLSPKLAARYNALAWLTLRGAIYDSFRAPTLNELYRPFQVGTILTDANPGLRPETLFGGELGVELEPRRGLVFRATGFANQLSSPIANLTLAAPLADGATRERENLGAARVLGVDANFDWRFFRRWLLSAAYEFVDARVTSSPAALLGKRLAQDPAHRFSAALTFADPRWVDVTIDVRVISSQFEDDLNTLPMAAYAVVDLSAARAIAGPVDVFAAIENLFNTSYRVGRAGIDTVGAPFSFRVGLRLRYQ